MKNLIIISLLLLVFNSCKENNDLVLESFSSTIEERNAKRMVELDLTSAIQELKEKYQTEDVYFGVSTSHGNNEYEETLTIILPNSSLDSIECYEICKIAFYKMNVKSLQGNNIEIAVKDNQYNFDFSKFK